MSHEAGSEGSSDDARNAPTRFEGVSRSLGESVAFGDTDSGLASVGIAPSPPLNHAAEGTEPVTDGADGSVLAQLPFEERYVLRRVLGRGGMGEVRLCRDRTVGRDVAMKVVSERDPDAVRTLQRRFVREARVQGQLEHPAIVPVYDVGIDPHGALYFTMKRIRGSSLADVFEALRSGDGATRQRYSERRLLALLSQVSMAVHFAHEKGVVHRDLKPANVMFGDFGEVYVLDWGLASLRGEAGAPYEERVDDGHGASSLATGFAGTPGYMAPEQVEAPFVVDSRADVYALGAMLYEVLTLAPMHPGVSPIEKTASTLVFDGSSPSTERPDRDVAPELDRLCREATRRSPLDRLASAEEMAARIDAYLDGDRDLALRRELAAAHADQAEEALAASLEREHDEASERARAMREVGAALALDPTHETAQHTLVRLMTEPPRNVPIEAQAEIDANRRRAYELAGRAAMLFYAGYLLYLPLLFWMGVRDWGLFAFGWGTIGVCAATTFALLRRPPTRIDAPLVHLVVSTITVGAVSVMFGPFVLVPMLALGNAVAYMSSVGHGRGLVPLAACLAVVVPTVLRWVGVLPDNYVFADGTWTILPSVFHIRPVATEVFLLAAIVGTVLPACLFVGKLRLAFMEAERKLQLQAWQLRQIVPEHANDPMLAGGETAGITGRPRSSSIGARRDDESGGTRSFRRP